MDVKVILYFNSEGEFIQNINGVEIKLNPWIGIQIDEWNKNPRDWSRTEITKFAQEDLNRYLKKIKQSIGSNPKYNKEKK